MSSLRDACDLRARLCSHFFLLSFASRFVLHMRLVVSLFAAIAGAAVQGRAQQGERFTAWTHPDFPVAEYKARHAAVLAQLGDNEALLVPSSEGTSGGETFRQSNDFEYLTGLEVPRSILVIDGRTRQTLLFVPRSDIRFESSARPNDFPGRPLAADPALRALSGVDIVRPASDLDEFLSGIAARGARVLINSGHPGPPAVPALPVFASSSAFVSPSAGELLAAELQRGHAGIVVANAYSTMALLRMIKSSREIAMMREAARVTMVAIARGAARGKSGVDERTLTGAFSADCMALGAQRDAFTPIIKSGANSLWPWRILGAHYDRRNRTMQSGELVIYDVGCERDHYASDMGRTFPVGERFTARQRDLVEMVRQISDAVIAAVKPGVTLADLQRVAMAAIPEAARPYMQAPGYFGHHLGLAPGDLSLSDVPLAPGMIITVEPWYYNHRDEIAVFIEDEILITAAGHENLTAALPRTAVTLEGLRAGSDPALVDGNSMRTTTHDGVLSFALDRAAGVVQVYDLLNGVKAASTPVCREPVSGELSPDDVSFVVRCARGSALYVNTASYAVTPPPLAFASASAARSARRNGVRKNEVLVVGTIHAAHRTSTRYGTDVLRRLLTAMHPDFVLAEIAPNRLDAATREFAASGKITEPRIVRFPEYVDVLFPLTKSMRFTIVPTAAWSRPNGHVSNCGARGHQI